METKDATQAIEQQKDAEKTAAEAGSAQEEQKVELTAEETAKLEQEKEKQREQSRIGRKVAALEAKMDEFLEKANSVFENLSQAKQPQETEDDIITKKELPQLLSENFQKISQAERKIIKEYRSRYVKQLDTLADQENLSPDVYEAVKKEMFEKYNGIYGDDYASANPAADCERNFLKALNLVLRKGTIREMPLKQKKSELPLGVGGDTTVKEKEPVMPELTDASKDYMKKRGLSPEFVKKVLAK